jgi:hypothetical protein
VEERDNRACRFVDNALDQFERMLRALAETDERNIRLFAGRYGSNLSDIDLGSDHFVPDVGDEVYDLCQAILALVGDEHTQTFQRLRPLGRTSWRKKNSAARNRFSRRVTTGSEAGRRTPSRP